MGPADTAGTQEPVAVVSGGAAATPHSGEGTNPGPAGSAPAPQAKEQSAAVPSAAAMAGAGVGSAAGGTQPSTGLQRVILPAPDSRRQQQSRPAFVAVGGAPSQGAAVSPVGGGGGALQAGGKQQQQQQEAPTDPLLGIIMGARSKKDVNKQQQQQQQQQQQPATKKQVGHVSLVYCPVLRYYPQPCTCTILLFLVLNLTAALLHNVAMCCACRALQPARLRAVALLALPLPLAAPSRHRWSCCWGARVWLRQGVRGLHVARKEGVGLGRRWQGERGASRARGRRGGVDDAGHRSWQGHGMVNRSR